MHDPSIRGEKVFAGGYFSTGAPIVVGPLLDAVWQGVQEIRLKGRIGPAWRLQQGKTQDPHYPTGLYLSAATSYVIQSMNVVTSLVCRAWTMPYDEEGRYGPAGTYPLIINLHFSDDWGWDMLQGEEMVVWTLESVEKVLKVTYGPPPQQKMFQLVKGGWRHGVG